MDSRDARDSLGGAGEPAGSDGRPGTADTGRRRLLKAGLSATPILLTVRSRPAWAQGATYPSLEYTNQPVGGGPIPEGSTATTGTTSITTSVTTGDEKKDKKPKSH